MPFVFLTASQDMGRRARLLEDGACDAITKPFHPMDLIARLRLHLKVKRLQDELLVKNATLARLSTVDELTGLRSRRYVSEVLSIEFQRARRYGTPLSLVMADLDHFKQVNDRFGHPGGDAVLQGVAELLLRSLRATDVGGRYGGEELLVVLPQIPARGRPGDGRALARERRAHGLPGSPTERPIHADAQHRRRGVRDEPRARGRADRSPPTRRSTPPSRTAATASRSSAGELSGPRDRSTPRTPRRARQRARRSAMAASAPSRVGS